MIRIRSHLRHKIVKSYAVDNLRYMVCKVQHCTAEDSMSKYEHKIKELRKNGPTQTTSRQARG